MPETKKEEAYLNLGIQARQHVSSYLSIVPLQKEKMDSLTLALLV